MKQTDNDGKNTAVEITTTPPWLSRTYIVRIVDLKSCLTHQSLCPGGGIATHRTITTIEAGLFVQDSEENQPLRGSLYIPRRKRFSDQFQLECEEHGNLMADRPIESETAIGRIFKKHYEHDLPRLLDALPLPEPPSSESTSHTDTPISDSAEDFPWPLRITDSTD